MDIAFKLKYVHIHEFNNTKQTNLVLTGHQLTPKTDKWKELKAFTLQTVITIKWLIKEIHF